MKKYNWKRDFEFTTEMLTDMQQNDCMLIKDRALTDPYTWGQVYVPVDNAPDGFDFLMFQWGVCRSELIIRDRCWAKNNKAIWLNPSETKGCKWSDKVIPFTQTTAESFWKAFKEVLGPKVTEYVKKNFNYKRESSEKKKIAKILADAVEKFSGTIKLPMQDYNSVNHKDAVEAHIKQEAELAELKKKYGDVPMFYMIKSWKSNYDPYAGNWTGPLSEISDKKLADAIKDMKVEEWMNYSGQTYDYEIKRIN